MARDGLSARLYPRLSSGRAVARLRAPLPFRSVDRSLVSRSLEPFWTWLARYVPERVAPNAITLSGFGFVALALAVTLAFCPALVGRAPAWVYAFDALAVFAFQTFDALDGKQARRTRSSSALGNWLDHACDVGAMQLTMLTVACSLNLRAGGLTTFLIASVVFNNYVVHWETKHTGTLVMDSGTSIYEAQVTLMGLHVVTLLVGPEVWGRPIRSVFPPLAGVWFGDATLRAWIVVLGVGFIGGVGVAQSFVRVARALPRGRGRRAVAELLPIAWVCVAGGVTVGSVHQHPLPFIVTTSLLGLRLIGRVILDHLADIEHPLFDAAIVPLSATSGYLVADRAGIVPAVIPEALLAWANFTVACVAAALVFVGATLRMAALIGTPILTLPRSTPPASLPRRAA